MTISNFIFEALSFAGCFLLALSAILGTGFTVVRLITLTINTAGTERKARAIVHSSLAVQGYLNRKIK